ncbi:MAG: peptidase M48 [Gemmatimonadales bacterium]|nr:MAG: peptidase M48 [Gemmatimonadales bacterium]
MRTILLFLTLTLIGSGVTSCVVNPVTGQRQFTLISEAQEIEIGREADRDISRSLGVYDDPELQAYVQELGERMARDSERPDLPWTFRVIDDPVINAFALPGGFIYVTRGILSHFSSEAELAGVLGHEIGHVTARHGVSRVSRAQLAQVTLGAGSILVPQLEGIGGELASFGVGLLFLSYSRDDERQADDLGLRYMTDEGYDPREMAATFEMLYNASGAEEGDRIPNWLSSHPDPLNRRDRILSRIESGEVSGERIERESYLQRLDGMTFGPNPREGFFRDDVFYHPDLAFRMDFPAGWNRVNQREGVQAISPEEDAMLLITFASESSATAARTAFLSADNVTGSNLRQEPINGLPAARADFRAVTEQGVLRGAVDFVEYGGAVYRLLGYAVEGRWDARASTLRGATGSFRQLTESRFLNVQPRTLEIVRTDRTHTFTSFIETYPSTVSNDVISTINRFRPGDTVPAGTFMKRVVGGQLP